MSDREYTDYQRWRRRRARRTARPSGVAVIDGVIHDTHDCGGEGRVRVQGYWTS